MYYRSSLTLGPCVGLSQLKVVVWLVPRSTGKDLVRVRSTAGISYCACAVCREGLVLWASSDPSHTLWGASTVSPSHSFAYHNIVNSWEGMLTHFSCLLHVPSTLHGS